MHTTKRDRGIGGHLGSLTKALSKDYIAMSNVGSLFGA